MRYLIILILLFPVTVLGGTTTVVVPVTRGATLVCGQYRSYSYSDDPYFYLRDGSVGTVDSNRAKRILIDYPLIWDSVPSGVTIISATLKMKTAAPTQPTLAPWVGSITAYARNLRCWSCNPSEGTFGDWNDQGSGLNRSPSWIYADSNTIGWYESGNTDTAAYSVKLASNSDTVSITADSLTWYSWTLNVSTVQAKLDSTLTNGYVAQQGTLIYTPETGAGGNAVERVFYSDDAVNDSLWPYLEIQYDDGTTTNNDNLVSGSMSISGKVRIE